MADRTVHTRWTGGMRAVSDVDGFEMVVDEPEAYGGTNTGPQPTDLFLASIGSCIALSVAFVARKRAIELVDLEVSVVGRYAGQKFERISVSVSSGTSREVLEDLIREAERVCFVSNTLRHQPDLTINAT